MRKNQILIASTAALALIGGLGACSSSTSTNGVKSGGEASVTLDGKPMDLGSKTVACTETNGKTVIAIGDTTAAGGTAGVGATLSGGDNPQVETVGLGATNGQALGWARGVPGGDANVTKDGKKYTISGTVTGIDTANPMSPSKKSFEIKVTCP
ncbi:lipoprotein LpqH [Gordonia sp. X0973]|uniref:lipoprotein LpqH n=1 Tax=Gordonia sp. X0973 TaxID=2742602 RepID=UPI000F536562|nr:lipoprotein LpqH [Gordonia sp. X0973]QKT07960.1 lipoprotein LpqH [Gordonia sp. X0973]